MSSDKPVRRYVPMDMEVGTATPRRPRPGYRWVTGWSEVTPHGLCAPVRRRDIYAMARRDGFRAIFCATEDEAQAVAAIARAEGRGA